MKNPLSIMMVAGEASGDMHGAKLVAAMREQATDISICGIGGPALAMQGMEFSTILPALPWWASSKSSAISVLSAKPCSPLKNGCGNSRPNC